jgi:hypothetical protein
MMPSFDFEFFLETVPAKLLSSTIVSFIIASVVGSIIGEIANHKVRRKQFKSPDILPPARNLISPAIAGAFIGMMLIGTLPIEASPASTFGDGWGVFFYGVMLFFLAPFGSILGAILGVACGGHLLRHRYHKGTSKNSKNRQILNERSRLSDPDFSKNVRFLEVPIRDSGYG